MATTIDNSFNTIMALQEPFVVTLSSNNTSEAKFRYILELEIGTDTDAATIKIQANEADGANIDIHRIIKSYVQAVFEDSGSAIHYSFDAVKGENINLYVKLKAGEEYAATSTDNVTEYLAQDTEELYILGTVSQFRDGATPDISTYLPDGTITVKNYLSNRGDTRATLTDSGNIAFINYNTEATVDLKLEIEFFDINGTQTGSTVTKDVESDLGAPTKVTTITSGNAENVVIFLPFYPANVEGISGVTIPSDAVRYTWQVYNNSGNTEFETMNVYIYDSCKYTPVRLAWINEFGCWDYFNFDLVSKKRLGIQRANSTLDYGTWGSATYSYNNYDRGEKVIQSRADEEYILTSDWIDDSEFEWLKGLLLSTEVQIELDGDYYAANVLDNRYDIKKSVNNNLNNLQVRLKTAHKLR